jgi:hypothetical protein
VRLLNARKLEPSSGGSSRSGPLKNAVGNLKMAAIRASVAGLGTFSPLSYAVRLRDEMPALLASVVFVIPRRFRARSRRVGLKLLMGKAESLMIIN